MLILGRLISGKVYRFFGLLLLLLIFWSKPYGAFMECSETYLLVCLESGPENEWNGDEMNKFPVTFAPEMATFSFGWDWRYDNTGNHALFTVITITVPRTQLALFLSVFGPEATDPKSLGRWLVWRATYGPYKDGWMDAVNWIVLEQNKVIES